MLDSLQNITLRNLSKRYSTKIYRYAIQDIPIDPSNIISEAVFTSFNTEYGKSSTLPTNKGTNHTLRENPKKKLLFKTWTKRKT